MLVETGLYYGGSQLWFAARIPHVITVEISAPLWLDYCENRHGLGFPPANAVTVLGPSLEVVDQVTELTHRLAGDGPVMVVLDSDHGTRQVLGELLHYGPLVTPGSYMVAEDGILHYLEPGPVLQGNWFDGDPLLAVQRFLRERDGWTIDQELEDLYPTTQHPMGWLRRDG